MLALTSYKQLKDFSVLDTDELFLINGGSSAHPILESIGNYLTTQGKKLTSSTVVNSASTAGSVASTLGSKSNLTGLGDFINLAGYTMESLGNCISWVAKNDSGNVADAMERYYEHH